MPANFNSAKRLLITPIIDISPSTGYIKDYNGQTANALINKHLKIFFRQLLENKKIKASAEVAFVTYSTDVEVRPFVPIKTLADGIPEFTPVEKGGTRTLSAFEAAYDAISKRAAEICALSTSGINLYTSVAILFTDGDKCLSDPPAYVDEVIRRVNECTLKTDRAEKILPIIVGLGSKIGENTKEILTRLSKGFVDGFFYIPGGDSDAEADFSKLFQFISKSLIASIHIQETTGLTSEESVDSLLNELRAIVEEIYPDMIRDGVA